MDFSITIGRYMFLILVKNFGPPTSRVLRKSPLKEYEPEWDCISVNIILSFVALGHQFQ